MGYIGLIFENNFLWCTVSITWLRKEPISDIVCCVYGLCTYLIIESKFVWCHHAPLAVKQSTIKPFGFPIRLWWVRCVLFMHNYFAKNILLGDQKYIIPLHWNIATYRWSVNHDLVIRSTIEERLKFLYHVFHSFSCLLLPSKKPNHRETTSINVAKYWKPSN